MIILVQYKAEHFAIEKYRKAEARDLMMAHVHRAAVLYDVLFEIADYDEDIVQKWILQYAS